MDILEIIVSVPLNRSRNDLFKDIFEDEEAINQTFKNYKLSRNFESGWTNRICAFEKPDPTPVYILSWIQYSWQNNPDP